LFGHRLTCKLGRIFLFRFVRLCHRLSLDYRLCLVRYGSRFGHRLVWVRSYVMFGLEKARLAYFRLTHLCPVPANVGATKRGVLDSVHRPKRFFWHG